MKGISVIFCHCGLSCLHWGSLKHFFRDMEAVKRNIYDYEDGIKKEFSAGKIIPFKMLGGTQINAIAAQDILRIPQHKLAGMEQVKTSVEQAGFRRVGRIGLPLSFLPYNQLQINHFPPEYTYYLRHQNQKWSTTTG